ncbi:DNA polymerase-3 subunit beta [Alkalithermobacter thermoalcaliphilus JW-YL-7 = DSM 7308]|uniref:Beta sliding clamp n=1 Tax=Alkalithermobacter thermoalcaliphilus JW-YL-7 = DSM 7308 TaxID=1121328 RepID=A0A150FT15_CLOPD|nr:DNA polymerase III, beta subunit [[Clostridium] paradoxum JW-YL-7 = DSM 7308]SHL08444.1 DNA polymerase-3 subunit beta [[Clostridium] paradoxum JW-YL-7 = DSM 7308]
MKLICSQQTLSNAISTVQKAVSSKTTLPILKGLLLECVQDKLYLIGNDLELGIQSCIDADVFDEGSVVIDSRLFGDIIRKLPNAPVEIYTDNEFNIYIKCEFSEFKIKGLSPEDYPRLPDVDEEMFYQIPEDLFKNMIKQTVFAISQDETKPILMGELLEIEGDNISLIAIDGYRLATKTGQINNNVGNIKVIIPGKALNEINRILAGDEGREIKISFTEKHALFLIDNTKIITRLLEGEFINYKQILPKEYNLRVKVSTKKLLSCIERASLLAKEGKNNLVKFSIRDDIMLVTSNSEIGNVQEEISISLEGEDLDIAFNSRYLMEGLKVIDSEEIYLEFTTNVSPCIIKPEDGEKYIYLLLPVRISSSR